MRAAVIAARSGALGEALGPARDTAREAALDALHAREIQRLNDLIPDGGM